MTERAIFKRVNFTMGGKGGVGKTDLMSALVDWFIYHEIPFTALDLDVENNEKGSLSHFYPGRVPQINVFTPAGLDAFIDYLDAGAPIVLADMGAGSGSVTHAWFNEMHHAVADAGIRFTAIGLVTDDPASVTSVLTWATQLQARVNYLIVENYIGPHSTLNHWREGEQAEAFRQAFQPKIIRMSFRIPDLENSCRNYGVTLNQMAELTNDVPLELRRSTLKMRAQSARRQLFAEFDKVKEALLP